MSSLKSELIDEILERNSKDEADEVSLTLLIVKIDALGTLVSCSLVIFFSPSKSKNDSNVGGAFILQSNDTHQSTKQGGMLLISVDFC